MAKVLIATDGSDASTAAAVKAVEWLGRSHQFWILEAVHIPVPLAVGSVGGGVPYALPPSPELLLEASQAAMVDAEADVAALTRLLGVTARQLTEAGAAAYLIRRAVEENRIDLVVVGSHGKGLASRVVMGSVSHEVLKDLPCSVLVVPVGP